MIFLYIIQERLQVGLKNIFELLFIFYVSDLKTLNLKNYEM